MKGLKWNQWHLLLFACAQTTWSTPTFPITMIFFSLALSTLSCFTLWLFHTSNFSHSTTFIIYLLSFSALQLVSTSYTSTKGWHNCAAAALLYIMPSNACPIKIYEGGPKNSQNKLIAQERVVPHCDVRHHLRAVWWIILPCGIALRGSSLYFWRFFFVHIHDFHNICP